MNRVYRKITEIDDQGLTWLRPQRCRLIESAGMGARNLVLCGDAHLCQASPERIIIGGAVGRNRICIRATGAQRAGKVEKGQCCGAF